MANLTLKNIPEELYAQLKEAASRHHRSINSEMIACLEKILMPQIYTPEEHLAKARFLRQKVKASKISVKEIAEAKRDGRL
jgi:plasmid stability protein